MMHDKNEHCLCDSCYSDDCKVMESDRIDPQAVCERGRKEGWLE